MKDIVQESYNYSVQNVKNTNTVNIIDKKLEYPNAVALF